MNKQQASPVKPHFIEQDGITRLHLSLAVNDNDHLRDLTRGVVRADGIILTPQILQIEEIFYRFTNNLEWDVSARRSVYRNGLRRPVFMSGVCCHSITVLI